MDDNELTKEEWEIVNKALDELKQVKNLIEFRKNGFEEFCQKYDIIPAVGKYLLENEVVRRYVESRKMMYGKKGE